MHSLGLMTGRLENKTALITGSTSNIGRAIAVAFGAEGAHVVVSGRDARRGAEVVLDIEAAGGPGGFRGGAPRSCSKARRPPAARTASPRRSTAHAAPRTRWRSTRHACSAAASTC